MEDIAGWRKSIDKIDTQLVKLFNERARCAAEIGKIKAQNGLEIYNPDREKNILKHVGELNEGPLSDTAVRNIIKKIIESCRELEKTNNMNI